ncbi:fibroblast growth factor receptor 2-like isoform X2 [Saccostrea cucullata]|uniref:fibroblast growth factor receptor 2-like isoform X2 n=1 Tax=Saccostrea cuccullata TaxID=36930 RepID=UPI002ED30C47
MVCGNPKPKVTWFAKGQGINASISGKYKVRRKTLLVVDAVSKKDEGLYMCVVENEHGSVNHTYELKVIDQMLTKPVIQGPLNQTVTYLDDAKFQCKVVMSDLQSHIQWLKHYQVNGSFTNEDEDPYVHVIQQSFFNLTDPEILYIRNVTYEDAGWYTCLVTNSMGRAYQSAWLTVEACKPGSYGKECKKVCGHCESNEPCNHINGSCPGSCEPGYKGEMCLATCNGGWYGRECKQRCGYCRDDEPCHHVTGSCSGFCEPGYLGDKCDESEFSQLLVIQRKMLSSVREILSFKRRKAGLIANGTFPADLK